MCWDDNPRTGEEEVRPGPKARAHILSPVWLLLAVGCHDVTGTADGTVGEGESSCVIPGGLLYNGAPKDGIPALVNPDFVDPGDAGAEYPLPNDRVVGIEVDGEFVAVPLAILWWHEIVNLTVGDLPVAVTHCPLTGSSLVFNRGPLHGVEFGVSGLLFKSNLIMYDRGEPESLWPQMERGARCGRRIGTPLEMVPAVELEWSRWQRLHPETRIVSTSQGHNFQYRTYPYGSYDQLDNPYLFFPLDIDPRRPPKEKVLGIPLTAQDDPSGERGIAFPFGELAEAGDWGVVRENLDGDGDEIVVFWDAEAQAAMAHWPLLDGQILQFTATADGIVDEQTGSTWSVTGEAIDGPLASKRLPSVPEAYVAYWFAWAAFHPRADLWQLR
jgi:hypothetical protein